MRVGGGWVLRTQVGTPTHEPLVAEGREDVTEASALHGYFLLPGSQLDHVSQTPLRWNGARGRSFLLSRV